MGREGSAVQSKPGCKPDLLIEPAPAKINLTLIVHGRRPDGYHELESLVAFAGAEAADVVTLEPGGAFQLDITGPGAWALTDEGEPVNLVARAITAALRVAPRLRTGTFRLHKTLPIAAGIGGGSADAAAALRLLRRANADFADDIDWMAIAASIGADVPVCLVSRASMMSGLGERVIVLPEMPQLWAVLANPGVPLATADVFRALGARSLTADAAGLERSAQICFEDQAALIAYVADRRNDLEVAARPLCPGVAEVTARLADLEGSLVARMSGSGPTCFALFASSDAAQAGARHLAEARPNWWIVATTLG